MKYVPVPGVVIIEPIEDDSVLKSVGRNYSNAGKVIGIAPRDVGVFVDVGDIIFYDSYAYRRFDYKGEEIMCVDTRGDGVWLLAKDKQNDTDTSTVQTEGVPS